MEYDLAALADLRREVSDADREASLRMLAHVDATLVLCGAIPSPREYRDQLPDGRDLHVVRAGARDAESVDYVVLTRRSGTWHTDLHSARIVARP